MIEQKTFGMISLGCDKNRVDTEHMLALLEERGAKRTNELSEAQILIINTCAFLNEARKESIETILDGATYKSGKLEKIVVTGCLPEKFVDELFPELTEADVFLGTKDTDKLIESIEESYRVGRVNAVHTGNEVREKRVVTTPLHFAYLKIADGCYNHCTYCLIPKIRGKYKSYPMEELVAEAQSLGDVSELILVAQDTTRYGEDLYGENKFVELIRRITSLDNIESVRLLYCYPDAIDDRLIYELKTNPKLIHYLDIPLQHSENRVLKLMNRRGTREENLALLEKIKAEIPDIAIRSTFIAGFPSETEEEVEGMISFLEEAKLTNCGFFAYSKEPDTAAFRMKGHLPQREKDKRVRKLYRTQKEISKAFLLSKVGTEIDVLCDGIDYDRECFVGRAYFQAPDIDGKVYFTSSEGVQGKHYAVKIQKTNGYDLFGTVTENV
ncbi:MAG: 30S ribosomal protein S12 methylthiotransferase RimO [Clostridia bacterium]|nr:30S ribosomal protein S12 methylthiotransferase RimO [Clostridia bacterium]